MLKLALFKKRLKSVVDAVLQTRRDKAHWYVTSQASERDKRSLLSSFTLRGTGSRTDCLLTFLHADGGDLHIR
jgi:hypothetical protein